MNVQGWPDDCFLGALTPETREELLKLGRMRACGRDENLVVQGDPGGVVYLLLQGRVNVVATVENGNESLLAIRLPGDLLGEMAVLGDMPRTATLTVRVPSTVLLISGEVFKRFVHDHPDAWAAVAAVGADRLRQANLFRADVAGYEVEQRLARTLLYQPRRNIRRVGAHWAADLLQSELAMLIGAKEGTVQKAMRGMKELVESRRGRIIFLDVPGLARLAEMDPPDYLAG
ncbi:Crp/Fnr family transcriptional regulator [Herbidospora galbida]|uniref:Crp/Fnr family transcriptional regulator n=1 Tax=Herbidospora galbida TaxID=2575442 RepID=A0A4U3MA85_9ACTN|nr:Crp/Fnr family transcriptional regulator [Herbidospora galbida]TKK85252.1 Crp/Fnr family transcriptional regulator [Herbidospora galbida]